MRAAIHAVKRHQNDSFRLRAMPNQDIPLILRCLNSLNPQRFSK
jgi:hypothetical protein